jgi:hypothetical protein
MLLLIKWCQDSVEEGDACEKLVKSAARFICSEMCEVDYNTTRYPSHDTVGSAPASGVQPTQMTRDRICADGRSTWPLHQ